MRSRGQSWIVRVVAIAVAQTDRSDASQWRTTSSVAPVVMRDCGQALETITPGWATRLKTGGGKGIKFAIE